MNPRSFLRPHDCHRQIWPERKDGTMRRVWFELCRYTQTVYTFSSVLLITRLSSQSAETTQSVQAAVGRENPDLARGAQIDAEVSEKDSECHCVTNRWEPEFISTETSLIANTRCDVLWLNDSSFHVLILHHGLVCNSFWFWVEVQPHFTETRRHLFYLILYY